VPIALELEGDYARADRRDRDPEEIRLQFTEPPPPDPLSDRS